MQFLMGSAVSNIFLPYMQKTGLYIAKETLKNTFHMDMFDSNANFIENWSGNILKDFLAKGFLGAAGYWLFEKTMKTSKISSVEKDKEPQSYEITKLLSLLVMFLFYFTGEKDIFDYVKTNLKQNMKMSKNELEIRESEIALGILNSFQENESNVAGDWTLYQNIVQRWYQKEIETQRPQFSYMYYLNPFKLEKIHPVRILFSVFVGLSISISNFFGVHSKKGSNSIQLYKLVLYIEILAHFLKVHHMGPLYNLLTELKNYIVGKAAPNEKNSRSGLEIKTPFKLYPSNPWS